MDTPDYISVSVNDLDGLALDWAVSKSLGVEPIDFDAWYTAWLTEKGYPDHKAEWMLGMQSLRGRLVSSDINPIPCYSSEPGFVETFMEQFGISVRKEPDGSGNREPDGGWYAVSDGENFITGAIPPGSVDAGGDTLRQAVLRCVVNLKLSRVDEIDLEYKIDMPQVMAAKLGLLKKKEAQRSIIP